MRGDVAREKPECLRRIAPKITSDTVQFTLPKYPDGTDLTLSNSTHTYPKPGVYTVTILSPQQDASRQQMPKINFHANNTVNNNSLKLISLDSPLLNMGNDLSSCFHGCKWLRSIPAGLFDNNTAATNFRGCFQNCKVLTSIPAGLFDHNIKADNFAESFSGCSALTSIPKNLFARNTAVTKFESSFYGCSALISIPAGLFDHNTAATTFESSFYGCSALTSIPAGLFEHNTAATTFESSFYGCSALTSIPAGLFDHNIKAKDFAESFSSCSALTSVPELLFAKNADATDFLYCFGRCYNLALNSNIFCDEATQKSVRFNGKGVQFLGCFSNCGRDLPDGMGGTAPTLWDYPMRSGIGTPPHADCFSGVTKVTNFSDIPPSWQ